MPRQPMYKQPSPQLSGCMYVAVALRTEVADMIRPCWMKLPLIADHKCDGATNICFGEHNGKPCAEMWTYDYLVRWSTTQLGRHLLDWWRTKGVTLKDD